MKANDDLRTMLSRLVEAQAMATALGYDLIAFLIGIAILEACNAVEEEEKELA
ncbi:MAG TPA: hypothetical protein VF601_12735 [Beijerinckiaceae bacterium]|jgi:Flp pilus assembly pilin Flp